jgi:hypothetical protein
MKKVWNFWCEWISPWNNVLWVTLVAYLLCFDIPKKLNNLDYRIKQEGSAWFIQLWLDKEQDVFNRQLEDKIKVLDSVNHIKYK